jgi:hypothetical protein
MQAFCGMPLMAAVTSVELTVAIWVWIDPLMDEMVPAAPPFEDLIALLKSVL